ncbi:MAG TPA: RDD family protein [Ignavibacteria bacterium]|nr:hypothetical protein [Bacteroidota bacterium]HRE11415.1 RDD family protein [Ignavibacteria bacterium]HRF65416.1 RDD family protein [Ignavibacteria bacterium]HRJ04692.1 RDD family protein [Ignavibacteria bacterium]HRJ84759.1 RDD family protein [Ignavibacteria bacterium]
MTALTAHRLLAFVVDYFLIILYAVLLFLLAWLFLGTDSFSYLQDNHLLNQLITFTTMTLPVFMYFFLFETSKWNGTPGKKIFGIRVISNQPFQKRKIFMRNFIKFLPWEISNIGVIWSFNYTNTGTEIPIWIWLLLLLPQGVYIFYLTSIIYYKGESSFYDKIANTAIAGKNNLA